MATTPNKDTIKKLLGYLPMTAEMYYMLRQQGRPLQTRFNLSQLDKHLPKMVQEATDADVKLPETERKKVFIFASLHYWIEHAVVLGVALAAQGHEVTLGYVPYCDWRQEGNQFDLRQQNSYARKVLQKAEPLLKIASFLRKSVQYRQLPDEVLEIVNKVSVFDVQYTIRDEKIDEESDLFHLRLTRNAQVARVAAAYFEENHPDIVIVPNGTIQEMGVVYQYARYLGLQAITYEFSDKRDHMWLAQNDEIMRQNTGALWEVRKDVPLKEDQFNTVRSLFSARQNATLWDNFSRLWQGNASEGGQAIREKLNLDDRPVALLATNVLGDSLTLGRNLFSKTMAQWVARTVQYFVGRPDVQLIIRIHPGELITEGLAMADIVKDVVPVLPEHIHMIEPGEKVNTYDIVEIASLGLVYTTTVGLEMAMSGKPVIVTGDTHYRGRGFTFDPDSWVSYYKTLGKILQKPKDQWLTDEQVELAWRYAYTFFYEYPLPFPWHLVGLWDDVKIRPMSEVFSKHHYERYAPTFSYLTGKPIDWKSIVFSDKGNQ